jgi:CBS domain-containing protein
MATVNDLMTPGPTTIESEASALAALDLMIDGGIRHLPVLDRARDWSDPVDDDLRAACPLPWRHHRARRARDRGCVARS